MEKHEVLIVGYPRSGNTWLARLIGEVLNSPVMGWGNARPIAEEGRERPGNYNVRQLHLLPRYSDEQTAIENANTFNLNRWKDEIILYIYRDPRDVAVSVYHYWNLPDVSSAITAMVEGSTPLAGVGIWEKFHDKWDKITHPNLVKMSYEKLSRNTFGLLNDLACKFGWRSDLSSMELKNHLEKSIEVQSFVTKKETILAEGPETKRNYGSQIQLHHLYRGEVGRWKLEFSDADVSLAKKYWGEKLIDLGYERGMNWNKEK